MEADGKSGANEYLAILVNDLAAKGVSAEPVVTIGNATDGIVWAADREKADLIAMSSHGRSGIGRLVLGSVADGVVRRTRSGDGGETSNEGGQTMST